MKNSLFITCAAAAIAISSQAQAEVQWFGEGYLGFGTTSFTNSDDDDFYSPRFEYSLGGIAGMDFNQFRVYLDAHSFGRDRPEGEDFDESYPNGAGSYGIHAGYEFLPAFGAVYVGGFYGQNNFQGDDASSYNDYVDGDLYGLETELTLGNTAIFLQFGEAEMVGDEGDTAFDGRFYRLGVAHDFDAFSVIADYEAGNSPDIFEDEGDEGDYNVFTITFERQVGELGYAYASLEQSAFIANTEDEGSETSMAVGFRMNIGQDQARTNLTTSYNPGLAAAWAETLD